MAPAGTVSCFSWVRPGNDLNLLRESLARLLQAQNDFSVVGTCGE